MDRRQVRGRSETEPLWRLLALVLMVIVVLLAHSVWRVWGKHSASQTARDEAQTQLAGVAARHEALEAKVKKLETPRGQEEEVRKNFPVAKEGEQVVIILDDNATTTIPGGKKPAGWWKKFWPFNN